MKKLSIRIMKVSIFILRNMNIPDKGNSHKKFVRSQTKFGFWGHIISMTGQFFYGEPFNVLKHKKHTVNDYQSFWKQFPTSFSNLKVLSIPYPNFSSGFRVKFCVFWNSWNDVQTSKLVIYSKFNVIILTNIIFDIKTSFFKDLEIKNLDDFQFLLSDLQFIKICLFQRWKFRYIQAIKGMKALGKKSEYSRV